MITTKTELDQKCSKYSQETSLVDVVDHCLLSGQVSHESIHTSSNHIQVLKWVRFPVQNLRSRYFLYFNVNVI